MTETLRNFPVAHSQEGRRSVWLRYVFAVSCGLLLAFSTLVATFGFLEETGHLPPPAIANNVCIDEKLSFMRNNPPQSTNFLSVGSSVAWRHVDSGQLAKSWPGLVPYNAGFCGLHINQTVAVVDWLLSRLPSVRHLLLVASPQDFEFCSHGPSSTFDIGEADRYVFQSSWKWPFYFRYFDPISLVRNARSIARFRQDAQDRDAMMMTKYGDAPLNPPPRADLVYDGVRSLDPVCFEALRSMVRKAQEANIEFVVVVTPLNPLWKKSYDENGGVRSELSRKIRSALDGTNGKYLDADSAFPAKPTDFTDAIHLRWAAAKRFTDTVIESGILR